MSACFASASAPTWARAADRQLAVVMCLVTRRTEQDQVARLVLAAVGAVNDVMDLEPARRAATRHAAALIVAALHKASNRLRNVLMRARRNLCVDRAHVSRIALGALDRRGGDR
jgi:hypothetical protein